MARSAQLDPDQYEHLMTYSDWIGWFKAKHGDQVRPHICSPFQRIYRHDCLLLLHHQINQCLLWVWLLAITSIAMMRLPIDGHTKMGTSDSCARRTNDTRRIEKTFSRGRYVWQSRRVGCQVVPLRVFLTNLTALLNVTLPTNSLSAFRSFPFPQTLPMVHRSLLSRAESR